MATIGDTMRPACRVVAGSSDVEVIARADAAAKRLDVPRLGGHHVPDRHDDFILLVDARGMTLHSPDPSIRRGMSIDLAAVVRRLKRGGLSWRGPLARAVGEKRCFVLDATAGVGKDAVMLTMLGHSVVAVERSPVLALMLEDAVEMSSDVEDVRGALGDHLRIQHGDARQVLTALSPDEVPDVVMIDPMFPPKRRRSALPRKEIQVLRQLVGDDADAEELFAAARRAARRRVVVKRADDAPELAASPTMSYAGKLVRYDVYVVG